MISTAAPRFWAVVPAAGKGTRMQSELPKQYLKLFGKTILEHTLGRLTAHPRIAGVALAVAADDDLWPEMRANFPSVITAIGGTERCHSVLNALRALSAHAADDDWVLVHDAARPCLHPNDVSRLIDTLAAHPVGGILAIPVRDTLKRCDDQSTIEATVDRTRLWHALTPQMFRLSVLREALSRALAAGALVTDEAQAVEAMGLIPRVVEGRGDNLKVTRPEDLALAELFLRAQQIST